MYNKVFKNYQINNLGTPFQIRSPISYQTIRKLEALTDTEDEEPGEEEQDQKQDRLKQAEEVLVKAREEAELIIQEAKLEASHLMQEAELQCAAVIKASEEEGRKQGYEKGYEMAMQQYSDLLEEAGEIRNQAREEYGKVAQSLEADVVQLIIDIARKVIASELTQNRECILNMVKGAFDKCSVKDSVILRISGDDYGFMVENREKLQELIHGSDDMIIKKDTALSSGSCLLETPYGSLDAGVETTLRKIEEAFQEQTGRLFTFELKEK